MIETEISLYVGLNKYGEIVRVFNTSDECLNDHTVSIVSYGFMTANVNDYDEFFSREEQ